MRQAQGSIVCASCGKLIGINEQRCPYCGAWRPGLFGWAPVLRRVVGQRLNLVSLIIVVCVTLYAVSLLLDPRAILQMRGLLNVLAPGRIALLALGMTGQQVVFDEGWWWTLLTANYLHGSLLHIVFNMLWIRNLGPSATEVYGPSRAFVIFNAAGVTGFLLSGLLSPYTSIGASAGVFGLLAALIVYGRKRGSSAMSAQLWQWAVILFIFGFLMPGVNNWAHGGGFLGGWIVASLMGFSDERRESTAVMITCLAIIVVTALGVWLSFYNTYELLFSP